MKVLKNYRSSLLLILAMFLGGLVGWFMGDAASVFQPVADVFLNLLYTLIVPMIFTSLVAAIAHMTDTHRLGKILGIMMLIFIVTGVVAGIYMIVVTILFDPAAGVEIAFTETVDVGETQLDVLEMLTVSDFNLLWSRTELMALIVFTLMFGIALSQLGEKGQTVISFFEQLSDVITTMIGYVMKIAPLGLAALFATLIGEHGADIVGPLSRSIIVYFVAAIVYYFASNTIMAFIGAGTEGIKAYWKNIIDSSLVSLGTSSSAAAVPTNIVAGEKIGISEEINNLAIPLGVNLHKDGAVLIQILKIFFVASISGENMMNPRNLITALAVSVIASTVMGAIPGGGYVGEIFIISAFAFPEASIPIMVLIGTITDAPATMINATGDVGAAMMLNRFIEGPDWFKKRQKELS